MILFAAAGAARPSCRDCADTVLGGPAENRYTAFDSLCTADSCRDQGVPQILVNAATLNLVVRFSDLRFGGPDGGFSIDRTWNLDDSQAGPLGKRWSSNILESLTQAGDGTVTLRRASGRMDRFAPASAPNTYFAVTATGDTLARNADGTYVLRLAGSAGARTFDSAGRLTSVLNGAATVAAFDYDSSGKLSAVRYRGRTVKVTWTGDGHIGAISDGAGRSVGFSYNPDGSLSQQANADGQVLSYQYDDAGNLTAINTPAGKIAFGYNADPPYTAVASITLPDGATRAYDIPRTPREIRMTDGAGDATLFASNGDGTVDSITDAAGNRTVYDYDAAGRRIKITDANGGAVKYDYDAAGNLTAVTDAAGARWTAAYDAAGRRTRLTDPNGGSYRFQYAADGTLNGVTNAAGGTAALSASGSTLTVTDPGGNRSTYQFDPDGFLLKLTDPVNSSRAWTYDAAGRAASVTDGAGSIKVDYDAANRMSAVTAGDTRVSFDFSGVQRDAFGRVTGYTDSFGNQVAYSYNTAGQLAGVTLPGGKQVSYEYDHAKRLSKVSDWAGNFALYRYDAAGWPLSVNVSGGPVTIYQYDAAHNLKAIVSTGPDGAPVAGYRYTLDANGNRTAVSALEPGAPGNMSAGTWSYDAAGRPTGRDDGSKFRYDARGNLAGIDGPKSTTLSWDAFGRLQSFAADSTATYVYDSLGLRAQRTLNADTRRYVYDVSGAKPRVVAETDGANNVTAYYVYGLGLLWKVLPDGRTYFYHFDGDGNVVAVSNPGAGVVNRYRYDALGRLSSTTEGVENAFRARGAAGWIDDGNGLLYNGAGYVYPEVRLTLSGTVDVTPPAVRIAPQLSGGGACMIQGGADCDLLRRLP